jgi:hypothetical protein
MDVRSFIYSNLHKAPEDIPAPSAEVVKDLYDITQSQFAATLAVAKSTVSASNLSFEFIKQYLGLIRAWQDIARLLRADPEKAAKAICTILCRMHLYDFSPDAAKVVLSYYYGDAFTAHTAIVQSAFETSKVEDSAENYRPQGWLESFLGKIDGTQQAAKVRRRRIWQREHIYQAWIEDLQTCGRRTAA